MLTLRLAWRNLWRNPRRTLITLAAIGLNAAILIASYSLMDGLILHTISNATNLVTGEVEIHAPKYLVNRSIYKSLKDPQLILERLKKEGLPAAARSYGYGLLAHGTKSAGAMFWGVDPAREKQVFDLYKSILAGSFLADTPHKGMVLGRKLARSLEVQVGDEIVVVVQAADGSLGNDLYTVTGILKTAGDSIDRQAAIIHQQDFQNLYVSEGRIHEIAVNTRGALPLSEIAARAAKAAPGEEVKTWRQLLPSLSDLVNLFSGSIVIFGMVFFLAGALGVMNTMLMATFERIREFGILKAIGTSPWRIMRDVAAEAMVMGLVATVLGGLLGLAMSWYLQVFGLDTSGLAGGYSIGGVALDPVWRAAISLKTVVRPMLVMWAVCLLSSLYPAAIAARLDPVEAISHV